MCNVIPNIQSNAADTQQPILADNNFNQNFNSVARKTQPP